MIFQILKRIGFVTLFVIVLFLLLFFNWLFLLLDFIFFPRFIKVKIIAPVFIMGMPRTGTTHLYRTLSADSDRFTSMKLWEILFAPSITQRKTISVLKKISSIKGWLISKVAPRVESILFKNLTGIHETKLNLPEEDDFILLHILSTGALIFVFPRIKFFLRLVKFDCALVKFHRKIIMQYYKGVIKRHLYFHGTGRTYLSKSASHTPKLISLKESFPGSKIIVIIRDPSETIASTLSLFRAIEKSFFLFNKSNALLNGVLEMANHWLTYPIKIKSEDGGEFIHFIKYQTLVSDLKKTVVSIYDFLGFSMHGSIIRNIEQISQNRFISKHRYSLEEFSLNKEEIQSRYKYVYKFMQGIQN